MGTLNFSPIVPLTALAGISIIIFIILVLMSLKNMRAGLLRLLPAFVIIMALANTQITTESGETQPSIGFIFIDNSASQTIGDRQQQIEIAKQKFLTVTEAADNFELREIILSDTTKSTKNTNLIEQIITQINTIPLDQYAGSIIITDGQVSDAEEITNLPQNKPHHFLITGNKVEKDIALELISAPNFVDMEDTANITLRVSYHNISQQNLDVNIYTDGKFLRRETIRNQREFSVPITKEGTNRFQFELVQVENEITIANNVVQTAITGIRDRLRVLLISGQPYSGGRVWRNLLTSDPNLDMVHFTILRPPQKQDGTPVNELSLIAFPTRELFEEKIAEFDLIIFDRFARQGVLSNNYFDNIVEFTRAGGAVFFVNGPEFSDFASLWYSQLGELMPARPVGELREGTYRPIISQLGKKHPVTRDLAENAADWGNWYNRSISIENANSNILLNDDENNPLLILSEFEQGRVGSLMSDNIWLWARGYDGGGPYTQLISNIIHWMLRAQDLEAETLSVSHQNNEIIIRQNSLLEQVPQITLETPDGVTMSYELQPLGSGQWESRVPTQTSGFYNLSQGQTERVIYIPDPQESELQNAVSTTEIIENNLENNTISIARMLNDDMEINTPNLIIKTSHLPSAGNNWISLLQNNAISNIRIDFTPIFAGIIGLILLIFPLGLCWYSER